MATRTLDHLWAAADSVRVATRLKRSHDFSPDVVVATAPAMESLVAGRLIAARLGVPLVAEMRDAWPDLISFTPGLDTARGPVATVKRRVHRFVTELQSEAAAVVTTTSRFAAVLEQRGMPSVQVIRNGTDPTRYAQVDAEVRDGSELRLLYMGTTGRSQGLDRVVAVAARLKKRGVPVSARIVGQGADWSRLNDLNRRLGRPVELVSTVPSAEVASHYGWADTIIVSLRAWEPFEWTVPSKLYEMMATGKHISGIVAGEAASIILQTGAGDVAPPGDEDALEKLWAALAADRSRLRVNGAGLRWVEQNASFDGLARRYLEVLAAAATPPAAL